MGNRTVPQEATLGVHHSGVKVQVRERFDRDARGQNGRIEEVSHGAKKRPVSAGTENGASRSPSKEVGLLPKFTTAQYPVGMFDHLDVAWLKAKSKVRKDGCWLWGGYCDFAGYGQAKVKRRTVLAHRLAWILAHGLIPDGMTVDHLCYTTSCVNPKHLRLLSHAENSRNTRGPCRDCSSRGHECRSTFTVGLRRDGGSVTKCQCECCGDIKWEVSK